MRKGQVTTEETKRKIGNSNRGKIRSLEIKKAISLRQTGKKRPPHNVETKRKIGLANSRQKISKKCPSCKEKFFVKPYKVKIQICCSKKCVRGKLHGCWKGGLTELSKTIMSGIPYKKWRQTILIRDNFTCVLCKRKKEISGKLEVDHYPFSKSEIIKRFKIKNYEQALKCKKLWDKSNGRTLCQDCHKKTETYLNRWHTKKI